MKNEREESVRGMQDEVIIDIENPQESNDCISRQAVLDWSMATTYYCSEYCPNCGAKMQESEDKG